MSDKPRPLPDVIEHASLPKDEQYRKGLRAHWEKQYGRTLSDAELEEIHANTTRFLSILYRWHVEDENKKLEVATKTPKPDKPL